MTDGVEDKAVPSETVGILDAKGRLRNLRCPRPACGRFYSSESALRNHIRLKHPFQGLRPKRHSSAGEVEKGKSFSRTVTPLENWQYNVAGNRKHSAGGGGMAINPLAVSSGPLSAGPVMGRGVGHHTPPGKAVSEEKWIEQHATLNQHILRRPTSPPSSQWHGLGQQHKRQFDTGVGVGDTTQYVQMVLPSQAYDLHYQPYPHGDIQWEPAGSQYTMMPQEQYPPQLKEMFPTPYFHPWEDQVTNRDPSQAPVASPPRPSVYSESSVYTDPYQPPHTECTCSYCQHYSIPSLPQPPGVMARPGRTLPCDPPSMCSCPPVNQNHLIDHPPGSYATPCFQEASGVPEHRPSPSGPTMMDMSRDQVYHWAASHQTPLSVPAVGQ